MTAPPGTTTSHTTAYEALRAQAGAPRGARERPLLRVDITTSSVAAGGDATLARLREAVATRGLELDIVTVGSLGFSFAEPTLELERPGHAPVVYGPVPPGDVEAFLDAVLGDGGDTAGRTGDDTAWAIGVRGPQGQDGLLPLAEHPFWAPQERRVMALMGVIDPESIDDAIAAGRYAGLDRALGLEPMAICDLVEQAGVGGRGGGGFPAGRKWKFLLGAPGSIKYLICNADEGDPGAFVNRILMESDPHLVVEGMAIAGLATGAAHGFIYIRDEYPLSIVRMQRAVSDAQDRGLLGEDLLGSDKAFTLSVVRGAGSYVCGEETGLIASVEGLRGMPKLRPPFPAQRGVFGMPSNVNNTETYAHVPLVLTHGAAWYREFGTEADAGTKMFSIGGTLQRTGIVELPFGYPMRDLLNGAGGGVPNGGTAKGVQPGGPLGGLLNADHLGLAMERPPFSDEGVLLGSGGLILFDERACPVDLSLYFSEFCEDESCGRCTTCHGGSQRLVEMLARICQGGGREIDLDRLGVIDRALQNANCLHGQFTPYAIRAALRHFREEVEEHVRERRCRAHACRGLIRHVVTDPSAPALAEAAALCPSDAFLGWDGARTIDEAACIQCGLCAELAPGAVAVQDRFPTGEPATAPVTAASHDAAAGA
jgi:NADH:ubiquinone oxidoreductase subunit F (NADH-binding)